MVSYAFRTPDQLGLEVRRVATERLDDAVERLETELASDPVVAIHEARKDIKKTRSLLRLIRACLGEDRFSAENGRLRDAAHRLAGAREADALSESLAALLEALGAGLSTEARSGANLWLARMEVAQGAESGGALAAGQASALLVEAREDVQVWPLGPDSFELVEPGLRRTYRQGRRRMAEAESDPSEETLHEWRKRVKDMWYSLRLLGEAWPAVIRSLSDSAHELSDLLGDHHDLGELGRALESGEAKVTDSARAELLAAIESRQRDLYSAAISLGRRLYAESPGRHTERLGRLWAVWENEAAQQAGQDGLPGS